jgi:hypothetical protein
VQGLALGWIGQVPPIGGVDPDEHLEATSPR